MGVGSLLAGCSQLVSSQATPEFIIRFEGDKRPDVARTISLTIGSYPPQDTLESGTSPPEWDTEMAFQTLYRLMPGEVLTPEIVVEEPGRYRLDLWVEQRGSIGTEVVVKADGTLSDAHTFVIEQEEIGHRRRNRS